MSLDEEAKEVPPITPMSIGDSVGHDHSMVSMATSATALAIYRLRTTNAPTPAIAATTRATTIAVVGPAVAPTGVG
jgi:hypothetical protein